MMPLKTLLILLSLTLHAAAADWPQWRGPQRTGVTTEKLSLDAWPPGKEPRVAWRTDIGKGHPNVIVIGDRLYTMGWDGKQDTVLCLSAAGGEVIWKQSYPCDTIVQWPGPRATAVISNGVLFTLGQHGQLRAWDATTGQPKWKVDLSKNYEPDVDYGFAWSPLIEGDLLILPAGSRGLAVRTKDGSFAWGTDEKRGACASATPFEHNGKRGVAVITTSDDRNSSNLIGIDPKTGKELWRYGPWKEKWGAVCVDLIVNGGKVFVTSSEQFKQCARYSVVGNTLKQDWTHGKFSSYTGAIVLIDGHLYGVDTKRSGTLKCIDFSSGEEKWSQHSFGDHASLIAADGKLLIQSSESGELVIAEASPTAYKELRRAKVFKGNGKTFTAPVYANGRIYCRSYAGELVCVEVATR